MTGPGMTGPGMTGPGMTGPGVSAPVRLLIAGDHPVVRDGLSGMSAARVLVLPGMPPHYQLYFNMTRCRGG
jgi:hypothetical protein